MHTYKIKASYGGRSITFFLQADNDSEALNQADKQAYSTFCRANGHTEKEGLMSWSSGSKVDVSSAPITK